MPRQNLKYSGGLTITKPRTNLDWVRGAFVAHMKIIFWNVTCFAWFFEMQKCSISNREANRTVKYILEFLKPNTQKISFMLWKFLDGRWNHEWFVYRFCVKCVFLLCFYENKTCKYFMCMNDENFYLVCRLQEKLYGVLHCLKLTVTIMRWSSISLAENLMSGKIQNKFKSSLQQGGESMFSLRMCSLVVFCSQQILPKRCDLPDQKLHSSLSGMGKYVSIQKPYDFPMYGKTRKFKGAHLLSFMEKFDFSLFTFWKFHFWSEKLTFGNSKFFHDYNVSWSRLCQNFRFEQCLFIEKTGQSPTVGLISVLQIKTCF